jgi:hypothetical protein
MTDPILAADIDEVVESLLRSRRHDPGRDVMAAAIISNLRTALGLLLNVAVDAGFGNYDWLQAIEVARSALGAPNAE